VHVLSTCFTVTGFHFPHWNWLHLIFLSLFFDYLKHTLKCLSLISDMAFLLLI